MSDDFLDSNVILYLFDVADAQKRETAQRLILRALHDEDACISFQVVQEVLNVISHKSFPAASTVNVHNVLDEVLLPLWRVMPSRSLYDRALAIHARYQYRFYDSLIIAAALESGCTRLYSEDLQHGQRIEHLTIDNPFAV